MVEEKAKKIKIIIFDFDGPILDSFPGSVLNIKEILKKAGLVGVQDEFLKKVWGKSIIDIFISIFKEYNWNNSSITPEKVTAEFFENTKNISHLERRGAVNFIQKLSQEKEVGMITNRESITLNRRFKSIGLDKEWFTQIIDGDYKFKKPDVRVFDPFLKKFKKEEIIFVGDTIKYDLKVANAAGIKFIATPAGPCSREDFINAGVPSENILSSITELEDIIA